MSSELKLKVVFDSTGAQEAADALPNAVDRANRKNRKFGDFTKGYTEIKDGSTREAGRKPAMERTAYEARLEAERQKAAEQEAANAAKADEDANKWWDQAAARGTKKSEQDEKDAERASKEEERRRKKAEKDAERASKEEEARRKKAEKEEEARRKKQEREAERAAKAEERRREKAEKEAEKAASADDWKKQFSQGLTDTLMRSIAPAALAAKAIEISWGYVIGKISTIIGNYESKITAGVDPKQVRAFQLFTGVGTTTTEQASSMAAKAQGNVNALATGTPGGNAYGFQYFGMTDFKRYREEGLPIAELLIEMTKRFKKEGGDPEYRMAAESIFGSDWETMKGMLAYANREDIFGKDPAAMYQRLEDPPTSLLQDARAHAYRVQSFDMSQKDLMGGVSGKGPNQMLSNVTSLQAMGGGDILSAIARGPQDKIADNTAAALPLLQQIAGQGNAANPQPAILK
jgi:hypothetical protein